MRQVIADQCAVQIEDKNVFLLSHVPETFCFRTTLQENGAACAPFGKCGSPTAPFTASYMPFPAHARPPAPDQ
jgi:hypothetical protein